MAESKLAALSMGFAVKVLRLCDSMQMCRSMRFRMHRYPDAWFHRYTFGTLSVIFACRRVMLLCSDIRLAPSDIALRPA